jgi:hypothetical protein
MVTTSTSTAAGMIDTAPVEPGESDVLGRLAPTKQDPGDQEA